MTILQLLLGTTASTRILNVAINALALCTFWWWGLLSWMPPRRFDLRDTQYVPGRSYLLRNSPRFCRHAGVGIDTIRDRTVTAAHPADVDWPKPPGAVNSVSPAPGAGWYFYDLDTDSEDHHHVQADRAHRAVVHTNARWLRFDSRARSGR